MKIGRWIGLGIFLSIVGVGITAVASTQVDFNQEIKKVFIDPTMEEKTMQFEEIKTIYYNGNADTIKMQPYKKLIICCRGRRWEKNIL